MTTNPNALNNNQNKTATMNKPMKPEPVPNTLNVTLNTGVPGFQRIRYKPNMTIPSIDKKATSIQFNPLIRLNPSVIEKVPPDIRMKEFFNKELFQSLLNSHGMYKEISLQQATKAGFVDNNIQVTLNTLFPKNGLIYINNQPYRIGLTNWKKGDWKIDKKLINLQDLEEIRQNDPFTFQYILNNELMEGERELNELPEDVVYGTTFDTSVDITAQQRKMEQEEKERQQKEQQEKEEKEKTEKEGDLIVPGTPEKTSEEQQIVPYEKPKPLPDSKQIQNEPSETQQKKDVPLLMPPETSEQVQELPSEEDDNVPVPSVELKLSKKSTDFVRQYFSNKSYYNMLNAIYNNMPDDLQAGIRNMYKFTTGIDVQESGTKISETAYNFTVKNQRVYFNPGKGDCFFIAVADGINYNNYSFPDKKIVYNNYGKGNNIFTPRCLRVIVADYITSPNNSDDFNNNWIVNGRINADSLNTKFEDSIKSAERNAQRKLTNEEYMHYLNIIFGINDNFFVYKPTSVPTNNNEYYKPFRGINSREEARNYIESSDYWANDLAIRAVRLELFLNIMPIQNENKKLIIPYGDFTNDGTWSKYMFLYFVDNNHYELMSFGYNLKTRQGKKQNKIKTIFELSDSSNRSITTPLIPPLYILYLIYGSSYLSIREQKTKVNFFLKNLFIAIDNSFKEICTNLNSISNQVFIKNFMNYFPSSVYALKQQYPEVEKIPDDVEEQFRRMNQTRRNKVPVGPLTMNLRNRTKKGGYNRQNYPYNQNNPYNNQNNPYNRQNNPYNRQNNPFNPYNNPNPFGNPYPSYGRQVPYGYSSQLSQLAQREEKKSSISYYITIDLELRRGKEPLTAKELSDMKCRTRWNDVSKAYAKYTNKVYIPPPVYEKPKPKQYTVQNKNTTKKNEKTTGGSNRHKITLKNTHNDRKI